MKTKFILALVLFVFSFGGVQAQCPPGDVIFVNQADVDAFVANYPNCTEIQGDLQFGAFNGPGPVAFNSLLGLQNIEIVHGRLIIYFMNPIFIGEPCFSLVGLNSLHSIGGLRVESSLICGFQGLSALEFIGQWGVYITASHGFSSFDGLNNLTSIQGHFHLHNLNVIGMQVGIQNFEGLENLISIGGDFSLFMIPTLQELTGIENLQYIGGNWLDISSTGLTSLAGLEGLNQFGGGSITIVGNDQLSFCSIPYFCLNPTPDNSIFYVIIDNQLGCGSLNEIFEYCGASSCSGILYADMNCNEIFDQNDVVVPNQLVLANSAAFAFSNSIGAYSGWLPADQLYQISGSEITGFNSTLIEIQTTSSAQTFENVNIGLCPDSLFGNLSVSISPLGVPNPGFNNSYNICVNNIGSVPVGNATLTLNVSDLQTWGQIILTGGGTITGNTITWNISDLSLFETVCFQITSQTTVGTPLGTLIELFAYVSLESDTFTEYVLHDNEHRFSHEVVGSFDPNDKEVNITAIDIAEVETTEGVSLEYLIRFQNTGTYPATFVRVIDILPEQLNPLTIQMLSASHDYELIFHSPNKLEWFFDNIFLADSTTNEPESHGYIHFRISTHPNLVVGESIDNRVSIYFDYNAPVVTNYAITHIGQCINVPDVNIIIDGTNLLVDTEGAEYEWYLNGQQIVGGSGQSIIPAQSGNYSVTVIFDNGCESTSDLMLVSVSVGEELADKIHLFPNPANENVLLELPQGNWQVSFCDITGKTLMDNSNLTEGRHLMNLSKLSGGLYLIHISSESGRVVKKLMVNN
jgi:uncharacterized repeat protein (TIGR01451 family)